jgi:hypothetical protein
MAVLKSSRVVVCVLACVISLSGPAVAGSAPQATPTPPPQIIRVITTPLCARMHERVRPAVAMILQTDQLIAKSPKMFDTYAVAAFGSIDAARNPRANPAPAAMDSMNVSSPATSMALQQMSYLVSPIAQNIINAQRMLDDLSRMPPTGDPAADKKLAAIRAQLLQTIASQSASLDLINGFVATQQMGELQHAGQEFIGQIAGNETTTTMIQQSPSPIQDPNTPGLSPNPYTVDLTAVPGLAVGYNPLSRIVGAVHWLQDQTAKQENAAAASITNTMKECNS